MKQVRTETGICHLRVMRESRLHDFLAACELGELDLRPDSAMAQEWLRTGSVYVDGRRQREDTDLVEGQIVRLHTRRKRYPAAQAGGWRARVIEDNADFLVFDKPSGLPTHATLDNFVENAKYVLEQEFGIPLHTTHRLDIPTEGLLILAKTPEAQKQLNKAFATGQVEKTYHALTASAVAPGLYTHFLNPETHVPREVQTFPQAGWWECRLQVEDGGALPEHGYWQRVRLLTGKTHQIRAQFAALGAPLLGDTLYGGPSGAFGLECYRLAFPFRGRIHEYTRPRSLVTV